MATIADTPFTALTLIAAPAVLTNASSVLALGTSNRFARAVDRARALSTILEDADTSVMEKRWSALRLRQLERVEKRCLYLVRALSLFYLALGAFSASALICLLGAVLAAASHDTLYHICGVIGLLAGTVGVFGVVVGCSMLLHETHLAVLNLSEEASAVRERFAEPAKPIPAPANPNEAAPP